MRVKILLTAFLLFTALLLGSVWMVRSELIEPASHPVTLPTDFEARRVSIPSAEHAVAGW
jgi:hypothetical protein